MFISEYKTYKIPPKEGTPVKTILLDTTKVPFFSSHLYTDNRRNAAGVFVGFVSGSSGEWWWIRHGDYSIGIYHISEVFYI